MNYRTNLFKMFALLVGLSCILSSCQKENVGEPNDEELTASELQFREELRIELQNIGYDPVSFIDNNVVVEGDIAVPLDGLRELYNRKQLEQPLQRSTKQRGYDYETCTGWWLWKECTSHGHATQTAVDNIKIRADHTSNNEVIQAAINKWNQTASNVHMKFVTGSTADILITRGGWDSEGAAARGVVGVDGNVGTKITLYNAFNGQSTSTKTAIIMHELGHNLGFAHTNETSAAGTYHISGTPTSDASSVFKQGATSPSFSSGDLTAIRKIYPKVNRCPYIGSWDGANCYIGTPPSGATASWYINSQGIYMRRYPKINGTCPVGYSASSTSNNCLIGPALPSGTHPFIWNNSWYVQPY